MSLDLFICALSYWNTMARDVRSTWGNKLISGTSWCRSELILPDISMKKQHQTLILCLKTIDPPLITGDGTWNCWSSDFSSKKATTANLHHFKITQIALFNNFVTTEFAKLLNQILETGLSEYHPVIEKLRAFYKNAFADFAQRPYCHFSGSPCARFHRTAKLDKKRRP